MAAIIIKRTSEFNNRFRKINLFIDGKKVESISNGETKEIETLEGNHKIIAALDWYTSSEILFEIKDSEKKEFIVGSYKNGKWLIPIFFGLLCAHIIINEIFNFNYILYAIIPVFAYLTYFRTFGKGKYLSLSETKTTR